MHQIVLVRHGESRNNIIYDEIRRIHGQDVSAEFIEVEEANLRSPDPGLSDRGLAQARRLGEFIHSKGGLDKALNPIASMSSSSWQIYSSPMQRALITTDEMVRAMGESGTIVRVHPELYESGGCYEHGRGLPGSSKHDIEAKFPGFICDPGMELGWFYGRPKEETAEDFMWRMDRLAAWLRLQRQNILLVVHGNLMSGLINRLVLGSEGNSSGNMGGLYMHYNTAFSHLQLYREPISLTDRSSPCVPIVAIQGVNRIDHLVGSDELLSGNRVHDDHWVQEYIPLLQVWSARKREQQNPHGDSGWGI